MSWEAWLPGLGPAHPPHPSPQLHICEGFELVGVSQYVRAVALRARSREKPCQLVGFSPFATARELVWKSKQRLQTLSFEQLSKLNAIVAVSCDFVVLH